MKSPIANHPKSSRTARQLINAAIRKFGSEVKAAQALGIPNSTQLNKMRKGTLHDTPAMKAAILQARARAKRSFLFIPRRRETKPIDPVAIDAALQNLDEALTVLANLLRHRPGRGLRGGQRTTAQPTTQPPQDTDTGEQHDPSH